MIFGIFYQANLTGSGLFKQDLCRNRLFINLIKNAKNAFFTIEKLKKYRKCPALPDYPINAEKQMLYLYQIYSF